ncbi:YrzI family protein [Brevibacillus fluminis]|uniref:YrzI family protein n=1 Tax=Brevibacillus fluminis TaxID=511487 RepID=A0A3M8DVS3_9BACL|nr:YrzI family protein [Brevibacillus fluminis]RNB92270.1 YrzI family protein [Brevibacillus fluminis]
MQISLIFFTIIIEKRAKTAETQYAEYLRHKERERIEIENTKLLSQYPSYITRL